MRPPVHVPWLAIYNIPGLVEPKLHGNISTLDSLFSSKVKVLLAQALLWPSNWFRSFARIIRKQYQKISLI